MRCKVCAAQKTEVYYEELFSQGGAKVGKYGYLVFAGGANRRKGTDPSLDGSVIVPLQ